MKIKYRLMEMGGFIDYVQKWKFGKFCQEIFKWYFGQECVIVHIRGDTETP